VRHVLNLGMGVDSVGIFIEYVKNPAARPCPLDELLVITAMTGDEWPQTGALMERHVLPLMREHNIRYVQVARRFLTLTEAKAAGFANNVNVLSDTRVPTKVYLSGDYKLSDEMISAGTVPQCGGQRRCSMHAKGDPLDAFLAEEMNGEPFIQYMGFEANEPGRAVKDARDGDTAQRTGSYPLIEWGWTRAMIEAFITEHTGAAWLKSACTYCPFALQTKDGRSRVMPLYLEAPRAGLRALIMEYLSVSLNERQGLIKEDKLFDLLEASAAHQGVTEAFRAELASMEWRVYEVRRVAKPNDDPAKGPNHQRSVRSIAAGSREEMAAELATLAEDYAVEIEVGKDGIGRLRLTSREDTAGAWEHFFVAAPAGASDKDGKSFGNYWPHRESFAATAAHRARLAG
jgi:hypothetical protein